MCVRHCHLVIYRSKECLRVGGQTIKTLLENSFGVHLFHLLIHSWHPNHQNISNPRKKNWRNFVNFLSFARSKSRTKCCRFLLMISWRYLKIHFTASLKKIITRNSVKKIFVDYEYFGGLDVTNVLYNCIPCSALPAAQDWKDFQSCI